METLETHYQKFLIQSTSGLIAKTRTTYDYP